MNLAELREHLADTASLIGDAEIICGIPSFDSARTVGNVVRAVEAGLRRYFPDHRCAIVISDGDSSDGTIDEALVATTKDDEDLLLIDPSSPIPGRLAIRYRGIPGKGSAFRTLFTLAGMTDVRALAVFDSDLRSITPEWVDHLVSPVLRHGKDFVAPVYARHKYDGTITNAIAYPLTTALYGVRLRQPIGGEFGFSARLAAHWSEQDVWETDVARYGIDIWMTTVAITNGFDVCQAQLGAKVHDPKDPALHLGPMFRQVVGSLFSLAGHSPEAWMDVDSIADVPTYGFRAATTAEDVRVKAGRMLWRFIEGYMKYEPVWRQVLSSNTLAAVTRATDEAAEKTEGFVLQSETWAHIVYDYLVAYNAGILEAGVLLDSMLPLFYARTATFVQEASSDTQEQAEERFNRFADLFFREKDHLRSRWRERIEPRAVAEQPISPEGDAAVDPDDRVLGAGSA